MNLLYLIIWPIISFILFLYINKLWGKKNHIALNIFYAITLLVFVPIEVLYIHNKRKSYDKFARTIIGSFNKKGLKYMVAYGSFLFSYRNNNFMDDDLDIYMYEKDFNSKSIKILEETGFRLHEEWKWNGELQEQCYKHKSGKSMDIFFITAKENKGPVFDEKNNIVAIRPTKFIIKPAKYKVNGIEFFGPKNPEEYLEWVYGNWKVRDNNYHWLKGPSKHPNKLLKNQKIKYKKYD